jgi:hypothetical protein
MAMLTPHVLSGSSFAYCELASFNSSWSESKLDGTPLADIDEVNPAPRSRGRRICPESLERDFKNEAWWMGKNLANEFSRP